MRFDFRAKMVLLGAVAVSLPSIRGFWEGNLDIVTLVTRFLIAIIFAWVATLVVTNVITSYAPLVEVPTTPKRRKSDKDESDDDD